MNVQAPQDDQQASGWHSEDDAGRGKVCICGDCRTGRGQAGVRGAGTHRGERGVGDTGPWVQGRPTPSALGGQPQQCAVLETPSRDRSVVAQTLTVAPGAEGWS